ncbi:MAG: hypothetical protein QOE77_1402 [Blastocatellia bacterium]|jgi:hypothetical protein|nr:hypothetical protein [Blastocatellia bacterium]
MHSAGWATTRARAVFTINILTRLIAEMIDEG